MENLTELHIIVRTTGLLFIFSRSIPLSPDLETDSWHQIYSFPNEMNILQLEHLLAV